MYLAQSSNAIAIFRATRNGEGREQVLHRLDPDTMPVDVERYRSDDQLVVGTTHRWEDVECDGMCEVRERRFGTGMAFQCLGRMLLVDDSEAPGGLGASRSPKDYLDLAKSPSAAEEQLRWLADSPYPFVVEAVARHPTTPADVLERLVPSNATSWNDQSLLLALAEHPASSVSVLTSIARQIPRLLHERDSQVSFSAGIALFRRLDTPEAVLLELLDDPGVTTQFRKVAARETTHRGLVLDRLRHDRSQRVRGATERRTADT